MKVFTEAENQAWSKTLPGKMTSACIALRSGDKVLMVKAGYKDHWTFPSGIVDDKESPKQAAIRETQEEVGVVVDELSCSLLTAVYTASNGQDRDRFNFAFIAEVDQDNTQLVVPNEEIESADWVDINKISERAGNRGSYKIFEKYLTYPSETEPYVEIIPSSV
ncbi:MAG: NUDIX hydrolase [bacterium]|nr:NUDIX hydrolase [bacterium]